ncbi:MAG: amidohydrolase family protein, partial [Ruminococcus sp.]|nr:amidohydrolase family protein [Ruminococcus sp.]
DVERYIAGKYENIWLDTGVVANYISEEQMLRLIRLHGADRVLFGSDCPWDNPAEEISLINRLPLSEEERESIFYKNAEMLIGIKE